MPRMRKLWILLVVLGMLGAGACTSTKGTLVGPTQDGVTVSATLGQKPAVTVADGAPPTTLVTRDIVVGKGAEAVAGKTATVQYLGISWSTKKEFDSSWSRGTPFPFPLGGGRVIAGWDQGVAGMKVGGRRLLIIPPALGYADRGAGADIKPGETLVFVVDLAEVS